MVARRGSFMKKYESLNRNQDFRRVYSKGKYISSPLLVTYILKNRCKSIRLGITTSKKIGNAVKRNRARRVLRAAYSSICEKLTGKFDIVFVARKSTFSIKSYDVLKEMSYQLRKLGVLN